MYTIKTYLGKSPINGIGVFAGEDIPEGKTVWVLAPEFDQIFNQGDLDAMPESARRHIKKHGFFSNGKIYLCFDYAQFSNHSDNPNTINGSDGMSDVAARDIKAGEEITCNYRKFDESFKDKLGLDRLDDIG